MDHLRDRFCRPCQEGALPLTNGRIVTLHAHVPDWALADDGRSISRSFSFRNFKEALVFINRVGVIAEAEGHHPDFSLHEHEVRFSIQTHSIGTLSENDFILAAKIDVADAVNRTQA